MACSTTHGARWIAIATVAALLTAGSVATAQNDQRREAKVLAQDSQELIDENVDSLSGQQKLKRAQRKISEAKEQLGRTRSLLKQARSEEKDIVKINCINDKQAATKGFLKVAEQSYVKLKQAVAEGDSEAANHHYTLVAVSHQKVQKLSEEAQMCAGEVQRYAEGTKVEVNVDDDVASEPRYLSSDPTVDGTLALPELTPFQ